MNKDKVDFQLVLELAREIREEKDPIRAVITAISLDDIRMTDAVIRLGMAAGILAYDYRNGWSEERLEGN